MAAYPRTPDEIYDDWRSRRSGIHRALTEGATAAPHAAGAGRAAAPRQWPRSRPPRRAPISLTTASAPQRWRTSTSGRTRRRRTCASTARCRGHGGGAPCGLQPAARPPLTDLAHLLPSARSPTRRPPRRHLEPGAAGGGGSARGARAVPGHQLCARRHEPARLPGAGGRPLRRLAHVRRLFLRRQAGRDGPARALLPRQLGIGRRSAPLRGSNAVAARCSLEAAARLHGWAGRPALALPPNPHPTTLTKPHHCAGPSSSSPSTRTRRCSSR
jgi:hypothetical protein